MSNRNDSNWPMKLKQTYLTIPAFHLPKKNKNLRQSFGLFTKPDNKKTFRQGLVSWMDLSSFFDLIFSPSSHFLFALWCVVTCEVAATLPFFNL